MTWSELREIAYNDIYLPFISEFNNLMSEIQQTDKKTTQQVSDISVRINCMETQMKLALQQMVEARNNHSAGSEVNIYSTEEQCQEQDKPAAPAKSRPVEKPHENTKTHSFVSGRDDLKIPIDVTMPSIMKDWSYTKLRWPRIGEKVNVWAH